MLLQIRVSAVSLILLVLIAQCPSNAHPQQGRSFGVGRWNSPSNGKVFIDTKHGPITTTNKLKTRKLGMVEKRKEMPPGFVAYTLDYHPPKHHPPKNN
ncbi:PREDICTED: uncharacterized protein LOC109175717 [Ipomoea nil]|uniref:uncharacterized protein LOC109175717 n=1 Tax=Ipomoea nil TaxID=35883 RepID=UPI000900933C|nr:PREDICTED: uncharacterized protein LOC109175717 [Ipomoea nil]